MDEILDYLLEVFECHQVEIDKFLAAFSNFDIDLVCLFFFVCFQKKKKINFKNNLFSKS